MKDRIRVLYLTTAQIRVLIRWSAWLSRRGFLGRAFSIWCDNLLLAFYGMEVVSGSLDVANLVVGHSTGVVLGGNGIRCTGTLHVSSGVVFARRYGDAAPTGQPLFVIDGDATIGANSVLLGPLSIKGPVVIGALSLVSSDITEPGVYVGIPARKIRDVL
jgi:serine acetyltransferase